MSDVDSVFKSPRAQAQVERILGYLAACGGACLLSLGGDLLVEVGEVPDEARRRIEILTEPIRASLSGGDVLAQAPPVQLGRVSDDPELVGYAVWVGDYVLCALARQPMAPIVVAERFVKARELLRRMVGWTSMLEGELPDPFGPPKPRLGPPN